MIERRTVEDLVVVSPWWTPDHLDVTHVPMTYAHPKAPWIERFTAMRKRLSSDERERQVRRRLTTHAVVDPNEITILPPLPREPN